MSETRFVSVGNLTLHYRLDGLPGALPLVFLNSLGSDLRIWDRVISYFAGRFAIIRYDKRGHGLSDCPPGPYTIRDHAGDLAALLAHLQTQEVILVGSSVGGLIGLDYAIQRPQQVKALILCDTAARLGTADYWRERIETLQKTGFAELSEAILSRWFSPGFAGRYPADYRGYANMLTRTPLAGYIATCQAIRDADLRAQLHTIKAKILVLCGAEDAATPPDQARGLAESLPAARFELIDQAGHLPGIEQPEIMATKITRFLQENGYG